MSGVMFATCNRKSALEILQYVYPDKNLTDTGYIKEFLDLVKKDIIRVQDPMMYGDNPQVVAGKNYNKNYRKQISKLCKLLTE